jgi:hypothetical protein
MDLVLTVLITQLTLPQSTGSTRAQQQQYVLDSYWANKVHRGRCCLMGCLLVLLFKVH